MSHAFDLGDDVAVHAPVAASTQTAPTLYPAPVTPTAPFEPMISLNRASRWYGQVIGLNDVSCQIGPGLTALLGPNGAGKSTLLKLLTGQIKPTTGTVHVLGASPFANSAVLSRIGYCPENDQFYEDMTGRQFVTFLAALSGYGGSELTDRVARTIERVGMTDRCDRKIAGYSKGMRQRIKLAQGILHEPRVLILDEPLNGLDPMARREVTDLLLELANGGVCVLIASHILTEVEQLTHNILLMQGGRILARGSVEGIRDEMDRTAGMARHVVLRTPQARPVAAVLLNDPAVVGIRFAMGDPTRLEIETQQPAAFYDRLPGIMLDHGFTIDELESPDDHLEAVIRILLGRKMSDLAVIQKAIRDAVRPRRLLTALLLVLLPSAIALVSGVASGGKLDPPGQRYDELFVSLILAFAMTILSVVYGTGIIADELEQRTIIFLLIRPLPRWRILLARYLVSVISVALITTIATLLLAASVFGFAHIGDAKLGLDLRALLVGSIAYGSLFLLAGALLPRPLIYGLLFVFGWEDVITLLPGSFSHFSIMTYLRVIAAREIGSGSDANPLTKGPAGFLFNLGSGAAIEISVREAYITLACITAVCLAAALWAFSTREYVPREEGD